MSFIGINNAPKQYQKQLRMADSDGDNGYNGKIDTPKEAKAALDSIKPNNSVSEEKAMASLKALIGIKDSDDVSGTEMLNNSKFNLVKGKIYSYGGAKTALKDSRVKLSYKSSQYSGMVHEYDGGSWNGDPIGVDSYSKLIVMIESGDALSATKVEINDTEVMGFGALKIGANIIDLEEMKNDGFDPMVAINKINFVNKPGEGSLVFSLKIQ